MASAFSYLTVLISIVLGLSIAHLLGGIARLISRRGTTRFYWPTLAWIFVLLVLIIQVWWVDYSLSREVRWTLAGFISTLLIPATLYVMSFLILPESRDMKETYDENRVWFFSLLVAMPIFGSLQQLLVEGHIHRDADTIAKAASIALCLGAIYLSSEKAQKTFAIIGIIFIVLYVSTFFFQLPLPA